MIPVFRPAIGADTTKAAVDALDLGWLGMGSYVREFEAALTDFFEIPPDRKLVAVNTCTSALHLALECAGVGPGDEVITPALNNIGDFQAIGMCGATPVFVDICEHNLGIDVDQIERMISPRTKAIIALHYMGIPCDVDGVFRIAKRHNLRVIEDAAHATGTRWHKKPVGSYGDLTCFSFDAIKTLTCIDGGAVVVPSAEQAEKIYPARLLGMTQSNERLYSNNRAYTFDVTSQGYRYHLANLHAAIGLSQLRRLPEFIANRRRYCKNYNSMLADLPGIITPQTDFEDASIFHYVIRVLDGRREELATFMKHRGVDTGIHWMPGNRFSRYKNCRGADQIPVTDRIGDEILTLPLWSYMEDEVIETVANTIRSFWSQNRIRVSGQPFRGIDLFRHAKNRELALPFPAPSPLTLRAVQTTNPRESDIKHLSDWRNQHPQSFLTEFVATPERTRRWLTRSIACDDSRILFMIEESGKAPIGYIGLGSIDWATGTFEADSVVRGSSQHPGAMAVAMKTLIDWAITELQLQRASVRVLHDNPALSFYKSFGFCETKREPLQRVIRGDCSAWETVNDSAANNEDSRWLVHMEITA